MEVVQLKAFKRALGAADGRDRPEKSLRNKADVVQRQRMEQRQLSTDFMNRALEWRRVFAEGWGTFLLVMVAAEYDWLDSEFWVRTSFL